MSEAFLHYVWQLQYFDKTALAVVTGEPLVVLRPGTYNADQGPDFSNAKIRVLDIEWAGNVEMHIKSSDWNQHAHKIGRAHV